MNKLYKVEDIVKEILEEHVSARGDDFMLVMFVYNRMIDTTNLTFNDIMINHKQLKLPCFESITRARRRLQSMYEELRPDQKIQDARLEEQLVYREYAR